MGLSEEKKTYREKLIHLRAQMDMAERARQSLLLGQNIAAFLDARGLPDRITVGVFSAMEDEIDLTPACALFYQIGATVAFPCVHNRDLMDFYALSAADLAGTPPAFYTDPRRLIPPEDCVGLRLVAPDRLDLILVPGLGFDRMRNRIGYGWGCYDRYLARTSDKCVKIGVCFDDQLIESLPTDEQDRPVDVVITPTLAF